MKLFSLASILIVSLFLQNSIAQEATSGNRALIDFPAAVKVAHRKQVTLADVAIVEGMTQDIAKKLESLIVVENPKAQKYEIESYRLVQMLKDEVKGVHLNIPTKMQVDVQEVAIEKTEIERKILNHLNSVCRDCDFGITSLQLPEVRTSEIEIDFEKLPMRGSFMIPLIEKAPQATQTKWITGQLKTYKDMPVLGHSLAGGQKLESQDIKWTRTDISFIKDVDMKVESFYGMEAVRNLNAGTVLNWMDFKKELVVKRGQILKALSGADDFEVSINVTAEENGYVGDRIKVKNSESNRSLNAEVVDSGAVRIR